MSLKYRTGQGTSASDFTDLVVKVGDTLPIGSEIDYDGQTVPAGWQEIDDPNVYSTTETRIGTWVDGRPIYRKYYSVSVSLPSNVWTDISSVPTNTCKIIINAKAYYGSGNMMAMFNVNVKKTDDGKVQFMNLTSGTINPTAFVLEYTKP